MAFVYSLVCLIPLPPLQIHATLAAVREAQPDTLLIYRSTPPGHADCARFTEPLPSPPSLDGLPYNWTEFPRQNALVRPLVEAVGGVWWDVNGMTELRADGHMTPFGDCLHHCSPGPIDAWVTALYNLLMQALP